MRRLGGLLAATIALLAILNVFVYSLYASGRDTVLRALEKRLDALGRTTARIIYSQPDGDTVLRSLVEENQLEDAYTFDETFRVIAGARTPRGSRLNLLRLDLPRARAAFEDQGSVALGYAVSTARIDAGYFPVAGHLVLAIEAGAEYHAPAAGLKTTWRIAVALSGVLGVGFFTVMALALRALERARVAHGHAERLAAIGQMSAMVAHEVRNPLGILLAHVELLRERGGSLLPERERERLDQMLVEIDRLRLITQEFLTLARDAPLEKAPCDLAALLQATVERIRSDPAAAKATIDVASPDGLSVPADRAKLEQAVFNLLKNAVEIGGPGVEVRLAATPNHKTVRISVSDNGPGVPPELRATLFEPFVGRRAGGSGLGLAVARRVAESHGGRLILEPAAPGRRGAEFSLYLPVES